MTKTENEDAVYLAGPIENLEDPKTWRDSIIASYPEIDFIDPLGWEDSWEEEPMWVIEKQLSICETNPVLVVNVGSEGVRTVGTHHEIAHALSVGNEKVALVPSGYPSKYMMNRVPTFPNVDMALRYLTSI